MLLPLNWRLSPAELAYQLDDAEPALLLVEDEQAELASRDAGGGARATERGGSASREVAPGARRRRRGRRRAAPRLHVRHDRQAQGRAAHPRELLLDEPRLRPGSTGIRGDDVVLQVLPQFHCGGWNVQPLLAWWKGATRRARARRSTPARCLELIEREARDDDDGRAGDVPLHVAGARRSTRPTSRACAARSSAARRCPRRCSRPGSERGVDIVQGYGLTEAAPNVLCLPPEDAVRKPGCAGKPYPHVDVRFATPRRAAARGRRRRASWSSAGRTSSPATGATPRRRAAAFADGWLLHRRRRRARRRGLLPHRRPAQGHVHLGRRERLPGRGRGRPPRAPGRRGGGGRRRARTSAGARSGVAFVVAAPRATAHDERASCVEHCAEPPRPLQGAEAACVFVDELPRSGDGQGAEGRAARALGEEAGVTDGRADGRRRARRSRRAARDTRRG